MVDPALAAAAAELAAAETAAAKEAVLAGGRAQIEREMEIARMKTEIAEYPNRITKIRNEISDLDDEIKELEKQLADLGDASDKDKLAQIQAQIDKANAIASGK